MPEPIAGPAAEPLTLAEAKAFLRVDADAEDTLIAALIPVARRFVESHTGRVLMEQTWRLTRDAWPRGGVFVLPVAPVRQILAATVADAAGNPLAIPEGVLSLSASRAPAVVRVDLSRAPVPQVAHGGIVLDVLAGYGADASAVPMDLMQAVRLLVAHFFEHRDGAGDTLALPAAVERLIAPYRLVRL